MLLGAGKDDQDRIGARCWERKFSGTKIFNPKEIMLQEYNIYWDVIKYADELLLHNMICGNSLQSIR